jgi:ribosomal protein S18 acetylase RimI-like enzyme
MDAHERVVTNVQDTYRIPDLWYLEVIAVHPCLQGRGLGRKALRSVLDHTNDEPVILECTNGDNVAFYERLGFKVVEEVELVEDGEGVKLWFMLRQGLRKQTD